MLSEKLGSVKNNIHSSTVAGQAQFQILLPRRTHHHGLGSFHLLAASLRADVDVGFVTFILWASQPTLTSE
jgi:hypothetical protein